LHNLNDEDDADALIFDIEEIEYSMTDMEESNKSSSELSFTRNTK
jgi:hypothetical protein